MTMDWKTLIAVIIVCYTLADISAGWISAVERMLARWMVRKGEK